ncbi:MAG: phage holin family protein [Lachnospiraceae bacterium]|nr:phage holin family protein [Lachnospiraceae bacterium]
MRKTVVSKSLLLECPNCGAPRVGDEERCRFCDSSLLERRTRTEEIEVEQIDFHDYVTDRLSARDADIVSDRVMHEGLDAAGGFFLFFGMMLIVGAAALAMFADKLVLESDGGSAASIRVAALFPLLAGLGIIYAAYLPIRKYKRFREKATVYKAVVEAVQHWVAGGGSAMYEPNRYGPTVVTNVNGRPYRIQYGENCKVLVRADIDGEETTILLNVPVKYRHTKLRRGDKAEVLGHNNQYMLYTVDTRSGR